MDQNRIGRRGVLGLGAAAGAVAVATTLPAGAGAAAAPGVDSKPDSNGSASGAPRLTDALTAPTFIPGAAVATFGPDHFGLYGSSSGITQSQIAGAAGAYAAGGGVLVVGLPQLVAGATLLQVDLVAAVSSGALFGHAWSIDVGTGGGFVAVGPLTSTTGTVNQIVNLFSGSRLVGAGEALSVDVSSTSATAIAVGVIVQYLPPQQGFVPIAPKRVFDSRAASGGATKLAKGGTKLVSVANQVPEQGGAANVVPAGARSIAYNVTITGTETSFGYLTIAPGGGDTGGPSTINWDHADATIANGTQVGLDANRQITILCEGSTGAKTHVIVDVVGYYL